MTKNLGLKIISLLTAILIWVQITLMAEHQSKAMLPLRLVPTVVNPIPPQAEKRIPCLVEGRGLDIIKLRHSRAVIQMTTDDYLSGNEKNYTPIGIPHNLKVNLTGIEPGFFKTIAIKQKPAQNAFQTLQSQQPEATVERILDVRINDVSGKQFFPGSATIQVKGPETLVAKLPAGLKVTTEETPRPDGKYALKWELPPGLTLLKITPTEVIQLQ